MVSLTLSLGNVAFVLSPLDDGGDGGNVNFVKDQDDYVVSLKSFTGTLRASAATAASTTSTTLTTSTAAAPLLSASPLAALSKTVDTKRRLEHTRQQSRREPSKRIRDELAQFDDGALKGIDHGDALKDDHHRKALDDLHVSNTSAAALNSRSVDKASLSPLPLETTLGQPDFSQSSYGTTGHAALDGKTTDDDTMGSDYESDKGRGRVVLQPARVSLAPSPRIDATLARKVIDECAMTIASSSPDNDERHSHHSMPCPRWGHTMTLLDDNKVLVYGGQAFDDATQLPITLADVHVCNFGTSTTTTTNSMSDVALPQWEQPFHCHGLPRQWHTATYLPGRRLLISLGGESVGRSTSSGSDHGQKELDEKASVMALDTEIMLWYPPTVSGDASPMKNRSGHSATLLNNNGSSSDIVVFGGVRNKRSWLSSIDVLDCTLWKWHVIAKQDIQGSAPPPRSYHSAVAIAGDRIVVFGGNNQTKCFNSVHVLQRSTVQDATMSTGSTDPKYIWKWSHPVTIGCQPKARTGHSAVLLQNKTTIWIYGGWDPNDDDDDDMVFGDSYYLDTLTWTWSFGPIVPVASQRVGHAAVAIAGNSSSGTNGEDNAATSKIALFGGRVPGNAFSSDFRTLSV